MSEKSHVSMEQKQCVVCGKLYDTGSVLMDTRIFNGKLRQSLEHNTITGYGLCPDHQKLFEEGYIALVEANNNDPSKRSLHGAEADRTGKIAHLKRTAADEVFNIELPKDLPMVFVEPGVLDKINAMVVKETE